jgi:Flp pilus assembly pilin Flp
MNRFTAHMRNFAQDETGAATAEYAIATMAAVGFAGLLVAILKGDAVRGLLTNVITGALGMAG